MEGLNPIPVLGIVVLGGIGSWFYEFVIAKEVAKSAASQAKWAEFVERLHAGVVFGLSVMSTFNLKIDGVEAINTLIPIIKTHDDGVGYIVAGVMMAVAAYVNHRQFFKGK